MWLARCTADTDGSFIVSNSSRLPGHQLGPDTPTTPLHLFARQVHPYVRTTCTGPRKEASRLLVHSAAPAWPRPELDQSHTEEHNDSQKPEPSCGVLRHCSGACLRTTDSVNGSHAFQVLSVTRLGIQLETPGQHSGEFTVPATATRWRAAIPRVQTSDVESATDQECMTKHDRVAVKIIWEHRWTRLGSLVILE
jgi:hypothetical protein